MQTTTDPSVKLISDKTVPPEVLLDGVFTAGRSLPAVNTNVQKYSWRLCLHESVCQRAEPSSDKHFHEYSASK